MTRSNGIGPTGPGGFIDQDIKVHRAGGLRQASRLTFHERIPVVSFENDSTGCSTRGHTVTLNIEILGEILGDTRIPAGIDSAR